MPLSYNDFQRQLQNKGVDPKSAYFFSLIYEQLLAMSQQLDQMAGVMLATVETTAKFTELHSATQDKVKQLHQTIRGEAMGVFVGSEPITNDPEEH